MNKLKQFIDNNCVTLIMILAFGILGASWYFNTDLIIIISFYLAIYIAAGVAAVVTVVWLARSLIKLIKL